MKFIMLLILFSFCFSPLISQNKITSEEKSQVVLKVAKKLKKSFVNKEIGSKIAENLLTNLNNDQYKKIISHEQFSKKINQDMQMIIKDLHLGLVYKPIAQFKRDSISRVYKNTKIIDSKVLPQNIGYLVVNNFLFKKKELDAAMDRIKASESVIIDLRENQGGNADLSNYLISYFMKGKNHYANYFNNKGKIIGKQIIHKKVKGVKMLDVPIMVLISKKSFSAAEVFAYDIQSLKRATIIGERSAGGAHGKSNLKINKNYYISMPDTYSINLITQSDWEGKGVSPSVAAEYNAALEVAIKEINNITTSQ